MNHYQIILPNNDVIKVGADSASADGNGILSFYTGTGESKTLVAQFCQWIGWNLLAPEAVPAVQPGANVGRTPVSDLPTGRY